MNQADNKNNKLPDLIPLKFKNNYCNIDTQCRLIITVKNQGFALAPPSTSRVEFDQVEDGIIDIPTPSIPPLEQVDLEPVTIPIIKTGNALFTITVNAKKEIMESNFKNNSVNGVCFKSPHCPYPLNMEKN